MTNTKSENEEVGVRGSAPSAMTPTGDDDEENDLVWRLLHPLWSHGPTGPAHLDRDAAVSDMRQAAAEIQRLSAPSRSAAMTDEPAPTRPTGGVMPQVSILDDELLIEWIGRPNHHVTISVDTDGAGYAIYKGGAFEPGVAEIGTKAAADEINAAIAAIPPSTAMTEAPHFIGGFLHDQNEKRKAAASTVSPPSSGNADAVRELFSDLPDKTWDDLFSVIVRSTSIGFGRKWIERLSSLRAALSSAPVAGAKQWHHKKSGHVVTEIGRGRVQASTPIVEMQNVVIYEHDGNMWVRAVTEFEDGRFEAIADPRKD